METKQAIIYARVSSVGDRQNTERQISDLRRYAEYSNLTVVKILRNIYPEQPAILSDLYYWRLSVMPNPTISHKS